MDFYKNSKSIVFTTPLPDLKLLSSIPKDANILEIGSGYSRILSFLHNNGFSNLTGIECSEELLARAKDNLPEAKYICGNALEVDLHDKYDLILICGTMEYFIGNQRQRLFGMIDELLNSNGMLYMELFTFDFSCIPQYIKGWLKTRHWGTLVLSNNLVLQHTSLRKIAKAFRTIGEYKICYSKEMKFITWSDTVAPGGVLILKKEA